MAVKRRTKSKNTKNTKRKSRTAGSTTRKGVRGGSARKKNSRTSKMKSLELSSKPSPERNPRSFNRKTKKTKKVKIGVASHEASFHGGPELAHKWGHAPKVITPTGLGIS